MAAVRIVITFCSRHTAANMLLFVVVMLAVFGLAAAVLWWLWASRARAVARTATRPVVAQTSQNPEAETEVFVCTTSSTVTFDVADEFGGAETVYELFLNSVRRFGKKKCLGIKSGASGASEITWQSYDEVAARIVNVASGLACVPGTLVAVYLGNCPEWTILEHALYAAGCANVPLYDTLGPDVASYVLNKTEAPVLVLGKQQLKKWREISNSCPFVKRVILVSDAPEKGMELFSHVESMGRASPMKPIMPAPEDLATISFTSGTTGDPKGVMLTHRNLVATVVGVVERVRDAIPGREHCHLSYLPLAHIFERVIGISVVSIGARMAYNSDREQLFADLAAVQPSMFMGVPRVFERIQAKLKKEVAAQALWKRLLFKLAVQTKLAAQKYGVWEHWLWDRLVFGKVAKGLGGSVQLIVSAGAPLSAELQALMRCYFSCPVIQAYGQTEAIISLPAVDDVAVGHVGAPIRDVEIKLVSEADLGFSAKNYTGELLVRGPTVFKGYYKDKKKTEETIDRDGWMHTGDVGKIDVEAEGQLHIISRKKEIFKLAQGEYVAPEKLEGKFEKSEHVESVFIPADSTKSKLVALVVPKNGASEEQGQLQSVCFFLSSSLILLLTNQHSARKLFANCRIGANGGIRANSGSVADRGHAARLRHGHTQGQATPGREAL